MTVRDGHRMQRLGTDTADGPSDFLCVGAERVNANGPIGR